MAHPYALVVSSPTGSLWIDVETPGWVKTNRQLLRKPGRWSLVEKATGRPVLTVLVSEGDQPYYTARHVGAIGAGGSRELVAYGLGKKTPEGTVRLWLLPNGMVCAGDDLEPLAVWMLTGRDPHL